MPFQCALTPSVLIDAYMRCTFKCTRCWTMHICITQGSNHYNPTRNCNCV